MKFVSSRSLAGPKSSFSEAAMRGMAPDGGLYVPESFPHFDMTSFEPGLSLSGFAAKMLAPFFEGDRLDSELSAICAGALDFPIPLKPLRDGAAVLELFHGPTCAFKDVGARFLAECLSRSPDRPSTIIVATSGDTGGAVAGAFFGRPGLDVMILYPKGKISARQEKQLTCWGENVRAFAVRGTFDDCQRVVKSVLRDSEWASKRRFLSANSISVGRLLPQAVFHARASLEYARAGGRNAGIVIPTGNLGDAVAALWAKAMGFPIARVVLATNANATIRDYFASGTYAPRASVSTLANAMDVGDPSNMERLRTLYPDLEALKRDVSVELATDDEISTAIRDGLAKWGEIWCPHTATAVIAWERARARGESTDLILAATAHPAKFETVVEPLIGRAVPIPPPLQAILGRPSVSVEIDPSLEALRRAAD